MIPRCRTPGRSYPAAPVAMGLASTEMVARSRTASPSSHLSWPRPVPVDGTEVAFTVGLVALRRIP